MKLTKTERSALLLVGAFLLGMLLVISSSGCVPDHSPRLAYDARARQVIDEDISDKAGELREQLSKFLKASDGKVQEWAGGLIEKVDEINALAINDKGRAQSIELYHGHLGDVEVEYMSDRDKQEVVGMAGLATEKHAERGQKDSLAKKAGKGVADFAMGFVGQTGGIIIKEWIPPWVWWLLGAIVAVAVCVCGYELYLIWRKNRALDEYDDGVNQQTKPEREKVKGTYAVYEHNVRRDRQYKKAGGRKRADFERRMAAVREAVPPPADPADEDILAPAAELASGPGYDDVGGDRGEAKT